LALLGGKLLPGQALPYLLEQVPALLHLPAETLREPADNRRAAPVLGHAQRAALLGLLLTTQAILGPAGLPDLPGEHVLRDSHLQVAHQQQDALLPRQQQDEELAARGEEECGESAVGIEGGREGSGEEGEDQLQDAQEGAETA
jgi:hypothetical protein